MWPPGSGKLLLMPLLLPLLPVPLPLLTPAGRLLTWWAPPPPTCGRCPSRSPTQSGGHSGVSQSTQRCCSLTPLASGGWAFRGEPEHTALLFPYSAGFRWASTSVRLLPPPHSLTSLASGGHLCVAAPPPPPLPSDECSHGASEHTPVILGKRAAATATSTATAIATTTAASLILLLLQLLLLQCSCFCASATVDVTQATCLMTWPRGWMSSTRSRGRCGKMWRSHGR